jgi:hypothetical protein
MAPPNFFHGRKQSFFYQHIARGSIVGLIVDLLSLMQKFHVQLVNLKHKLIIIYTYSDSQGNKIQYLLIVKPEAF